MKLSLFYWKQVLLFYRNFLVWYYFFLFYFICLFAAHRIVTVLRRISTAYRLSSCDIRAYLLRGMWDLSSQTRDRSCVPCIARLIFNHWTICINFKYELLLNVYVRGQVKSKLLVTNTQRKNKGTHFMDTKISQRYTVNKTKASKHCV